MGQEKHAKQMKQVHRRYVERWDYNQDGIASCDDINIQRIRLFKLLDTDSDKALTSGEFRHAKFEDKSFMFFDFLRVDTNGSGHIDIDELVAVPHSLFLNADKDGNCIISPPEAMAMAREMQMRSGTGEQRGRGGRGGKGGGHGGRSPVATG